VTLLTNFSANEDFFAVFWTRLTNMDSAKECFSGCARLHKAANMNGRAIPWAYLFRLYVCDKEMNWPLILNKLWNFGRRIVKTLCTYFQFNSIKCIIYFQYNSVKIVSFSFYFPLSFIQLGSCSSEPLVSFRPFIVCFLLFYKTYL